jgi:hypothetical protein
MEGPGKTPLDSRSAAIALAIQASDLNDKALAQAMYRLRAQASNLDAKAQAMYRLRALGGGDRDPVKKGPLSFATWKIVLAAVVLLVVVIVIAYKLTRPTAHDTFWTDRGPARKFS